MGSLGRCVHCGKSIEEGKKTCGATFAVCNRCKAPLHPHCIGEHKLLHSNQDHFIKDATHVEKKRRFPRLFRILSFIYGIFF